MIFILVNQRVGESWHLYTLAILDVFQWQHTSSIQSELQIHNTKNGIYEHLNYLKSKNLVHYHDDMT